MIAKDVRGSGFRGALGYVLAEQHAPEIVTRESVFGSTPEELAQEFGVVRRGRPDVLRPVHHIALSFSPEDRKLSPFELDEIARRFMKELGYEGAQYVAVEHKDRDHQHLHIVASRIRPDRSLVRYEYRDWEKGMAVLRQIERDYGLRTVERDKARGKRQPRRGEYRLANEHGILSGRMHLQGLVKDAWEGNPELATFVERLREHGVSVRLYRGRDGGVSGISYGFEGRAFGGFSLGPSYTWKGILREGVEYHEEKHKPLVSELAVGERLTWRERAEARKPNEALERLRLLVRSAAGEKPTLSEFLHRLDYLGVRVHLNVASTGYVSGITYELDGETYKGSLLGREYSWKGIQGLGVSYEEARDADAVRLLGRFLPAPSDAPARSTGKRAEIERVRALISGATTDRPTFTTYVTRLEGAGVGVRAYLDQAGTVFSLGYRLDGTYIRSRDLGRGYSWEELRRKHIRFIGKADERTVTRIGNVLDGEPFGKKEKSKSRGKLSATETKVSRILQEALEGRPTLADFAKKLEEKGVEMRLYRCSGVPTGVSYHLDDQAFRGRALGEDYTWQTLRQEGGPLALDQATDETVIDSLARDVATHGPAHAAERDIERARGVVIAALEQEPTLTEFVTRLETAGVGVRLYADPQGRIGSIAYRVNGTEVKGTELGPGHSWSRLVRGGIDFEPTRDREVLARVVHTSKAAHERKAPTPEQLERVRLVVCGATLGRPTYTEFVRRVESAGVEVRLVGDASGPRFVDYGLGDARIKGTSLGPGHSWRRLETESLTIDRDRDAEALRQTFMYVKSPAVPRPAQAPKADVLVRVRRALDLAAHHRPTFTEFARRVEKLGVEVRLYRDPAKRVFSVSYGLGDASVKARDLGYGYSWRDLKDRTAFHGARDAKAVDVRATTLERPRSVTADLGRIWRAARGVGAWASMPEKQLLRLGGRLLYRGALELARGAAYAAALRRAEWSEQEWEATVASWRRQGSPGQTGKSRRAVVPGPATVEAERRLAALTRSAEDFAMRYRTPRAGQFIPTASRGLGLTRRAARVTRRVIDRGF